MAIITSDGLRFLFCVVPTVLFAICFSRCLSTPTLVLCIIVSYCILLCPIVYYCVLLCTIMYYSVHVLFYFQMRESKPLIYICLYSNPIRWSELRRPLSPTFTLAFAPALLTPLDPTRPHSSALFLYSLLTVSALTPRCAPRGLRGGCPPLPLLCPQPNIEASACRKHRLLLMLATWLCRLMCNSLNSMTVVSF